jgi:hypothetical protein
MRGKTTMSNRIIKLVLTGACIIAIGWPLLSWAGKSHEHKQSAPSALSAPQSDLLW